MQMQPTGCYILSSGGDVILQPQWGDNKSNNHFIIITQTVTQCFEPASLSQRNQLNQDHKLCQNQGRVNESPSVYAQPFSEAWR